ncbi:non-ribosomal peptide synthetase, partial [Pseudomonadota bacterium]
MRIPDSFTRFPRVALEQSTAARFDIVARTFACRDAVRSVGGTLDYARLHRISTAVAVEILRDSPRGNQTVAFLMNQGTPFIVSALAALMAGRAFVPLDPRSGPDDWRRIMDAAGCGLVLYDQVNRSAAASLADSATRVRPVAINKSESPPLTARPGPETDAYIYFTSGSTGAAKGVIDSQRNVMHNIMRYTNSLYLCPQDRLSLIQSPSFSGCVSSLLGALLNGACVCPYDIEKQGLVGLPDWVSSTAITVYHSVPSIFRLFARQDAQFPDVRVVRLEGDAAGSVDAELFNKHFSRGSVLVNGLGATECGLVRQLFFEHGSRMDHGVLPVGYPVPDVNVDVTDEDGGVLESGSIGEVVVRSRFVARGYLGQPDLSARRFIKNDRGEFVGYRTGDLGRLDPEGCLTILGRAGAEVRINGILIDMALIEKAVLASGIVRRVLARAVGSEDITRVVLYCEPVSDYKDRVDALRALLMSNLSEYSIPVIIFPVSDWPLTKDGKVDPMRLPLVSSRIAVKKDPASIEWILASLWCRILRMDVSPADDVFEHGADSLSVASFVMSAREQFDCFITEQQVFSHPTSRGLALALSGGPATGERSVRGATRGAKIAAMRKRPAKARAA